MDDGAQVQCIADHPAIRRGLRGPEILQDHLRDSTVLSVLCKLCEIRLYTCKMYGDQNACLHRACLQGDYHQETALIVCSDTR